MSWRPSHTLACSVALQWVLGACATPRGPLENAEPTLRERMRLERTTALAKLEQAVCWRMPVGVASHDWIVGTVMSAPGAPLQIRIVNAGRFEHGLDRETLRVGQVLTASPEHWQPCTPADERHDRATIP